ncbi:MAG: T9SS C-terminal target domain-containing protein [Bacteroidetes bacterium]|nr:MAG: T9SS C-terminal target domain-containing protein [Bacteroidota bacterium]
MMKIFPNTILTLFVTLLFSAQINGQQIAINEFMASNATTIADEDGDYEDWIELYNYGVENIDLTGWGLSDDYTNPMKWVFPEVTIGAGEYLLVWASGKDKTEPALHTNFRISSMGEELILSNPEGNWISEVSPVLLPTDISFGKGPEGTWLYFDEPTPGGPNNTEGYEILLQLPELSHTPGFYTDTFYLKVSHHDPDATVYFTLDGSVPTEESEIFPDSLFIYNRKNDPDQISAIPTTPPTAPEWFRWLPPMDTVFKGTNIRLKAFREGTLSPFVKTATFWVDEEIQSRYSHPVISIAMDQDDLLGPDGIYTRFNMSGTAWERDMHIEYFEPDGSLGFSTDAGVRVHGGNSRRYALKSFRVYFRNAYGESRIDYPIFPQQNMNTHERLILRNAGSDWAYTYFRDAFVQSILEPFTQVETQAYRPAIVFLNSEYWGVMNIRERFDNKYIEHHYGVTEIDMLDNTGHVKYGSNSHYLNLLSFLQNNSLEDEENYEWVKTQMDVEDFRDYHILQVFSMNTDQPGKNVRFWRPQTPDGRWRWMWWDMDDSFIFGPHNYYDRNGLVYCTGLDSISDPNVNPATPPPAWAPNGPTQTFPLRALLGSPEFRKDFINRFADLLNTAFQPQYLQSLVDSFDMGVNNYMYEHYRRWHRPEPFQYNNHVNHLHNFSQNRKAYMKEHIVSFFELVGSYLLHVDIASGEGHVRVNSIHLTEGAPAVFDPVYPWEGTYFSGIPLEIEAIAAPGYVFSHWEGYSGSDNAIITIDSHSDISLKAHFEPAEENTLITFWYFSTEMPNNTPLEELEPWYSITEDHHLFYFSSLEGYPFYEGHPSWRLASMERRNAPTDLNYLPEGNDYMAYNHEHMRGMQVKQPFAGDAGENTLVFNLPSTGYEGLVFRFAAMDEGAANQIIADYSFTPHETNWTTEGLYESEFDLTDQYQVFELDFRNLAQVNHNENFKIRLRFACSDPYIEEGNRVTFNNISLEGIISLVNITDHIAIPDFFVYPNPADGGRIHFNKTTDVYLFDTNGRLIRTSYNTKILDVSELISGIYILRTFHGNVKRIVVINP